MTKKNTGPRPGPALFTPPSASDDHTDRTDELTLDQMLVGDSSIWAQLFDGRFKLATRCDICGRWLTASKSKKAGRGPSCAARAVD